MFSLRLVRGIRRFFFYQIAVTSVCPAILEVSAIRPALNIGL